jgi:Bacterial Ig-like domain/von Willebrand factor type A domain
MPQGIATLVTATALDQDFAIKTESTFTDNQGSQFDRTASPSDDTKIYAALGFTLNGHSQLTVKRDNQGNPLTDNNGKFILADRALAVSDAHHTLNVPNNRYANLIPPQVVPTLTIDIPEFEALKQQELATWITPGSPTQTFSARQPLNSDRDWQQFFPANGNPNQPTVVRVKDGNLTIPANVVLKNIVVIVEQGDIHFNGPSYQLDRVLLIAAAGNINTNQLRLQDCTLIASGSLNFNQALQCTGFTLLLSGDSISLNQSSQTLKSSDNLWLIAQGEIFANAALNVRAAFLSGGGCTINQPSTINGTIAAKGDIRFNAPVNFTPTQISQRDTTAPVITVKLLRDTSIVGTNEDGVTSDPSLTGQVIDSSRIVEFRAGLDGTPVSQYVDVLPTLQGNGQFIISADRMRQLAGGTLSDGSHTVHLQAKDEYGNESSIIPFSFVLDTTTPIPQNLDLTDSSDSGSSNTDNITRLNVITITGVAEANAKVQLTTGDRNLGESDTAANGTWNITTPTLPDGTYLISAIATDLAGNISPAVITRSDLSTSNVIPASATLTVIIDSQPPTINLNPPLDLLRDRARIAGSVDGTGSAVTSLTYHFDRLQALPITVNANGTFDQAIDFTGVANGVHSFTLIAVDMAGNILTQSQNVTVDLDHTAPVIFAGLVRDTAADGGVNADLLTFDPSIAGTVTDASQIVSFQGRFQGKALTDLLLERQADGKFLLEKAELETLYGAPLPDGMHTLELQAQDEFGNQSPLFSLKFTLDTQTPIPTLALAAASDSFIDNDRITNVSTPTFLGTAEPQARVRLVEANQLLGETIADSNGNWQLVSTPLTDGLHELRAIATDLAGNTATAAPLQITIDSINPDIQLATPTNAPLKRDSRLKGQVLGTGSAVVNLEYVWNDNALAHVVSFDNQGNFDQPFNFTGVQNGNAVLKLTGKDLAGNQTVLSVPVTLALNAAPVITSQAPSFFPLTQRIYRYQIQVSDADNDPITYRLLTGPNGTAISVTGELSWTPEASVQAGDRVTFTIEASDGRGGVAQQTFNVDVLAQLGSISGLVWNDVNRNTFLDHEFVRGRNPVVVFVVDVSGSTGRSTIDWTTATIEDVHNSSLSILDMEKAAIVALSQQMLQQGRNDIRFGMVLFNSSAITVDLNPVVPGVQSLITVSADADRNNVTDLIQALNFPSNGATNFTPALLEAEKIFTANSVLGSDANILFLSDGVGSLDVNVVTRLRGKGINLKAFGVTRAAQMSVLQQIDPTAIQLLSAKEISEIFSNRGDRSLAEPGMAGVRVYLDMNGNGVVDSQEPSQLSAADDPNTLALETGRFSFTNLLPGSYTVRMVMPNGFVQTTPIGGAFVDTVTATGESFSHLFGIAKAQ